MPDPQAKRPARFHGRIEDAQATCGEPGCDQPGEFRAPAPDGARARSDQPGPWRYLCLDHVRLFNSGYNYYGDMSAEQIEAEQRPFAGWDRETRAFASSGADRPPSWADFNDPLEAISARFRKTMPRDRKDGRPLSGDDRRALKTLGLDVNADRHALRTAYAGLVRRFHPDRNGGDRSHEHALQDTIAAYQQLKGSVAFA